MERRFGAAGLASEDRRFPQAPPAHRAQARLCGSRENTGTSAGSMLQHHSIHGGVANRRWWPLPMGCCYIRSTMEASRALRSFHSKFSRFRERGTAKHTLDSNELAHTFFLTSAFGATSCILEMLRFKTRVAGGGERAHVRRALLRWGHEGVVL